MGVLKVSAILLILLFSSASSAVVHVNGYFKKNGTYVQPHYRSDPNGNLYDNWSTKGNVNPYTGKIGTKNPDSINQKFYPSKTFFVTPLNPSITQSTSNINNNLNISFISMHGADQVGVYKWDDECLIVIGGRNNYLHGLAIWFPESPNYLYIFPWTNDVKEAIQIFDRYNNIDSDLKNSLSFLALGSQLYELYGENIYKDRYPILVREFQQNLAIELMDENYFLVQLKDFNNPEGMTAMKYGLFGFSEALAKIRTSCLPDKK